MDHLDLNVLREIMMVREPLIPILANIESMRAIVGKLNDLSWDSGKLAETVLTGTSGGREACGFRPSHSEYMGM